MTTAMTTVTIDRPNRGFNRARQRQRRAASKRVVVAYGF
jgi:hypothetical protein